MLLSKLATIAAAALAAAAILAVVPASRDGAPLPARAADSAASTQSYSYGWPVKPFDRQHPVRGNFGDPRTTFAGPPTRQGLYTSACNCSYHQGIDISAPDGTAVYPVESGVVSAVTSEWVQVDVGGGRAFQYWHIGALVGPGQSVERDVTVLGRILRGSQHVHLTELESGRAVNPLAPGHIGPYADRTTPRVTSVEFRTSDTGPTLLPAYVRGRVEIVAAAQDMPTLPVPGIWNGLPVSPAKVTFTIRRLVPQPTRVVVPETTAVDVTRQLPSANLWTTYARGTHMNMPNFGQHRYWRQPAAYLFKLTSAPFDTTRLHDGIYRLVVTAADTAGNSSSYVQVFSVHNDVRWLG